MKKKLTLQRETIRLLHTMRSIYGGGDRIKVKTMDSFCCGDTPSGQMSCDVCSNQCPSWDCPGQTITF